eukprot:360919-Chlamydomonas_euryale.AAC.9
MYAQVRSRLRRGGASSTAMHAARAGARSRARAPHLNLLRERAVHFDAVRVVLVVPVFLRVHTPHPARLVVRHRVHHRLSARWTLPQPQLHALGSRRPQRHCAPAAAAGLVVVAERTVVGVERVDRAMQLHPGRVLCRAVRRRHRHQQLAGKQCALCGERVRRKLQRGATREVGVLLCQLRRQRRRTRLQVELEIGAGDAAA